MYGRAKIMKAVWVMVRRAGNRKALACRLSRAPRSAWDDAKDEAKVARVIATEALASARSSAAMTIE